MKNMRHETALERSKRDVAYTREALIQQARYLSGRLAGLANGLERSEDHGFNSIGELQSSGVELDRLCGVLHAQREAHKILEFALEPTRMCRFNDDAPDGSGAHYWDTNTGGALREGDPGTEGFTPEERCPEHPAEPVIGKSLGCYGCDGQFATADELDAHEAETGHGEEAKA